MKTFYSMGIMNYCSHDPGCALVRHDGTNTDLIFAEEGFLSRKKKSYHFPIRSMKYCLDYFGISIDDVDIFVLDHMDYKRDFRTSHNYRLLIGDFIRSRLKVPKNKICYAPSHHFAHALTAFWPSGFEQATVMVVDGLGSGQQTHSIFKMSSDGAAELLYEQKGTGIGTLYTLVTSALGFDSGEEGKTMGLAPYGLPHEAMDTELPNLQGKFFGLHTDYGEQLWRNPTPQLKFSVRSPREFHDIYNSYHSRLAYNLQKETERCLLHLATESIKLTGVPDLCFAGGVALNCVANDRLQELKQIGGFFIQPASGDTGIPIGLALHGLISMGLDPREVFTAETRKKLAVPYSADKSPLSNSIDVAFTDLNLCRVIGARKFDAAEIAGELAREKIVACFSQGIEIGPRALGHRSFLADPRTSKMKDILNKKIKHREAYRPFAPMVLAQHFDDYFVSKTPDHRFMLQAPACKERAIQEAPAICHVDKTARVQTVDPSIGKVHDILTEFYKKTHVPIIINTSFNDNNEPIVFTKIDAISAFLNCNADILILEDDVFYREDLIKDPDLQKKIDALSEKLRNSYFTDALRELCNIKSDDLENDLLRFIKFNAGLTQYYRRERMYVKFIDYFHCRDTRELLVLDDYHFEFCQNYCQVMGISFNELVPDYKVVSDSTSSIDKIPPNSVMMLYNLSSVYHSKFDRFRFSDGIVSFYDSLDKILDINIVSVQNGSDAKSLLDALCGSYENNNKASIEEFFTHLKISHR